MRKSFVLVISALALALWSPVLVAQQQGSSATNSSAGSASQSVPNDVPSPDDSPESKPAAQDKKPSRDERLKPSNSGKKSSDQNSVKPLDKIPAPPRSDDPAEVPPMTQGESSSKDTKVDLSPPVGDAADHPDSSPDPEGGPTEFHAWDPHRAMKNVEVGDYYFKRDNYRAAASRYQEALQWKPRDAEATYKLAEAYEKMGDHIDARHNYEEYLSILPKGPRADDAHKALARLESN